MAVLTSDIFGICVSSVSLAGWLHNRGGFPHVAARLAGNSLDGDNPPVTYPRKTSRTRLSCAVCSVQCAVWCEVCSVQCALCCVQCAVCCVQCAVYSVQCAVCSVLCAVCSVQCAVCSVQCAVCSVRYCRPIWTKTVKCRNIFVNFRNVKFHKNPFSGSQIVTHGQVNRQKLTAAFLQLYLQTA
jgi:hypothetical protein